MAQALPPLARRWGAWPWSRWWTRQEPRRRSGTLMAREGAASSVSGYNGGTLNGMLCGGGGMLSSSGGNGLLSGGGGRAFNGGIRLTSAVA